MAGAVSRPERWGARLCAAWVACAACGAPPPPRPEPDVHEVEPPSSDWDGWLDSDVVPLRYSIDLRVVPAHDRFEGSASIRVRLASPRRTIRLHGRGLEVIDAFVEHRERRLVARYTGQRDDESYARIDLDEPVSGEVTLVFRYRAPFTPYEGLSRVDDGDERYVFSHLPPIAARTVFPCFDEPRFKAPFELTLRTQPTDVAISNAPIVSTNDADGMRVSVFAPTEPLPTYLFALAVGPFDVVERHIPPNEIRSRAISFRGVALHREGPELRAVMAETPRYLAALERYLGIPYPYAKLDFLANPDAEYAGMENPGAVVFDSDVILTSDRRLSDESRSVVIHELAHQWFGDYVTTASWQDLWLNEGVATFLDARIREDLAPRSGVDLDRAHWVREAMTVDRRPSARLVREPVLSSHDMHAAFDDLTYEKAAAVLYGLEGALGRDRFRAGLARYLRAHPHGSATARDFYAAFERPSVEPAAMLGSFLDRRGIPHVEARLDCRGARPALVLAQRPHDARAAAGVWVVPVCVRLGRENALEVECTVLDRPEMTLALSRPECPAFIHPNARGSGYYHWSMPEAESQALRRSLARLSIAERMSFVSSLAATFDARAPNAGAVLDILIAESRAERWAIASIAAAFLARLYARVLAPEDRDAFRARVVRAYGAAPLAWGDARSEGVAGPALELVAGALEEPRARGAAARLARAWAGLDGPADRRGVDSRHLGLVLAAGVRAYGAPMFDALESRLEVATSRQRWAILRALASTPDPALAARALALIERISPEEASYVLSIVMRCEQYALALAYLAEHFDPIRSRLSPRLAGALPRLADDLCSEDDAARVEAIFAPRSASLRNGPRELAYVLDDIRSCAAQVEGERAALHEILATP